MSAEQFIEHVSDPVLALDDGNRIAALNNAARRLFDLESDVIGRDVSTLFASTPTLADRYRETLRHYPDLGGVVEDGVRHFDTDHPTVDALREGTDPESRDPDVGVFVNGRLQYFHITESPLEDMPDDTDRLVIFRDITQVKRRERDLDFLMQVVTRVLRHNLRNDLNVVRGYAATIEERVEDPIVDMAAQIRDTCEDLVETSEKARLIQEVIDTDDRTYFDLAQVVGECVASLDGTDDDAELTVDVPSLGVTANPHLPRALEDTIENGIIYSEESVPRVEISAVRDGPWVDLAIADNGPGIPDNELETLSHRGESDLVHGSGAGLWLTYTVVQESGGDITYETGDDGTTVRMRLPAAESE